MSSQFTRLQKKKYLTRDYGLSIRGDDDSIAGEVGDTDPQELLACVSVPHPHIVCAAGSKQLRRISAGGQSGYSTHIMKFMGTVYGHILLLAGLPEIRTH